MRASDVLVIDEATQGRTADMTMITEAARQAGARTIAVGDTAQPIAATVTEVGAPGWGRGTVERGWEHGDGGPLVHYVVTRDGRTWTPPPGSLWAEVVAN